MRNDRGFTLIELMIVVVIIGILAAIAIPKFQSVARNAKQAEADPMLRQVLTLQERYEVRYSVYTLDITQLEGGSALAEAGEYFTYGIVAHASGFCVVATPTATAAEIGITARSVDATRTFYDSATCS